MNEQEILIYHYSTTNREWRDVTAVVDYFYPDSQALMVKFKSIRELVHVSYRNIKIYENPVKVDFDEIRFKNSPCYNVKMLLCFDNLMYKIFYNNGHTCVAHPSDLKIIKDKLKSDVHATGIMAYYRRVVQETASTEEDKFLLQEFDNISVVDQDSILSLYLDGKLESRNLNLKHPFISPFGINLSQAKALKMVFENRISIIEGPPGTGKTQTILNIIANAIINGYTVAVVSNNNAATDNVYEKLDKYGYSFVSAPLGNADNVEKFFEEYYSEVPLFSKAPTIPDALKKLFSLLPSYFEKENKKKQLIAELDDISLEYKHFLADHKDIDFSNATYKVKQTTSKDVLSTILDDKERRKKLSFWRRLLLFFKYKFGKMSFKVDSDNYVIYLTNYYYLCKIEELKDEIAQIESTSNNQSLDEKVESFKYYSKVYFENYLAETFSSRKRDKYEKKDYKRRFEVFVKDYPVILSSTYSLAKCSQNGYLFDYLIVDESSQVNMASAILSMRMAKNIVVVGDIKQLPQIDDDSFKNRNNELLQLFKVPQTYSYYGNSIMSSLLSLYGDTVPRTMLREHYRCNPEIIAFCNQRFYNNMLIAYTKPTENDYSMKIVKTAPGNHARSNPNGSGQYNLREIEEIKSLIEKEKLEDVGVIAPYRYHTDIVCEQLGDMVEASTIHKFQGREKKTIIFSSVANTPNDFIGNDNLVNVAVSRAIDKFILVTSDKIANSKTGVLSDLVSYISYHTSFGEIEEGSVKSIYDLLYKDYQDELEKFISSHPSDGYVSESLTKELLKEVLKAREFSNLWFRMHVTLRDFIKAKGIGLTDDEYKFYKHPNSHVDFMIYNKISKRPVLIVEVDGVTYHEKVSVQIERDSKKDSILNKAGIPILRLKTNESEEKERIVSTLKEILFQ